MILVSAPDGATIYAFGVTEAGAEGLLEWCCISFAEDERDLVDLDCVYPYDASIHRVVRSDDACQLELVDRDQAMER